MTAVSDETGRAAAFEKAWANRPWIAEEETDKDRAFRWWKAALSAAPVAQEPVATKATQQASADFLHEEMIKLGSPLTYTACLTLTKRITDTNTLAWAGEVNKLCTEIGSLKNEIAALKSAANPPATPEGVGADEIARAFEAGALAVHNEWCDAIDRGESDPPFRPDFSEAAHDYALALLSRGSGSDQK